MWILNLGKPVNIPVLSQEMAIELGANLLGESVIFVIGAGLLIVEYARYFKLFSYFILLWLKYLYFLDKIWFQGRILFLNIYYLF